MQSWPWIERADDFWRTAELVLYQEKFIGHEIFVPLWAAGVNFHISMELYLKALLLARGKTEDECRNMSHILPNIYAAVLACEPSLAGYEEPLTRLDVFGNRKAGGIYPTDPTPAFSDWQIPEQLAPLVRDIRILLGIPQV